VQTEETKNADWNGPMGIVSSVALSGIFGWIYLLALTSVVTDIPYLLDTSNDAGGYAVAQALYTTFHRRYGTGVGGIVCLGIIAVAVFLCGTACVTSNSRCVQVQLLSLNIQPLAYSVVFTDGAPQAHGCRMGYAFSRDGAMPFSHVWHRVNEQEVPLNVVWLSVSVAFVMALTVRVIDFASELCNQLHTHEYAIRVLPI
jgi:amino acid transporter